MTDAERNAQELAETRRVMEQVQERLKEAFFEGYKVGWRTCATPGIAPPVETAFELWQVQQGAKK